MLFWSVIIDHVVWWFVHHCQFRYFFLSSMNIDQGQGADLWSIRSLFFIKRKFKQFHQYQQRKESFYPRCGLKSTSHCFAQLSETTYLDLIIFQFLEFTNKLEYHHLYNLWRNKIQEITKYKSPSSLPIFSGCVARSVAFCIAYCKSFFLFFLAMALSVLRFMASNYPIDIFKLFTLTLGRVQILNQIFF
jgi:hypothetical protein